MHRTSIDIGRWELIDGVARIVPLSPSRRHQQVLCALAVQLTNFFRHSTRRCEVYTMPFDVRLPGSAGNNGDDITTVVQPDIFVVSDLSKLDDRGCLGPPDLIVEVSSPGSAAYNMKDKLNLYEREAVKEYWIVDPNYETVMVCKLSDTDKYSRLEMYGSCDRIEVPLLGDLMIDLAEVFEE